MAPKTMIIGNAIRILMFHLLKRFGWVSLGATTGIDIATCITSTSTC